MYTLCIGGMIFVALMPLFKGPLFKGIKGRDIDLQRKTFCGNITTIEQDVQQARDKALFEGIYPL